MEVGMTQFVPLLIPLPLIGFWAWMFRDMSNSRYLSSGEKNYWLLAFVLLNIFGAAWYYAVEYRPRH